MFPHYRYIAYLSPTTYVAEIMQSATGYLKISTNNLIFDWVVLSAVCAVVLFIAYKKTSGKIFKLSIFFPSKFLLNFGNFSFIVS